MIQELLEQAEAALGIQWPSSERRRILGRARRLLEERSEVFTEAIVKDARKPRSLAQAEVHRALCNFDAALAFLDTSTDQIVELDASQNLRGVWRAFPRGVVLGITPYNFPLNLVLHKVLPALCLGAPIIIKPDPRTPRASQLLADLFVEAELPKGLFQVIECSVEQTHALCRDARVEVISFTGSERVGWLLKETYADKQVLLELGGTATAIYSRNPVQVDDTKALARAALVYSGQVCISTQNVLVERSHLNEFVSQMRTSMSELSRGEAEEEGVVYGPIIDASHAERLLETFRRAEKNGAAVEVLGEDRALNLAARLITLPHADFEIAKDEVFGPALIVIPYDSVEDVFSLFESLKSTLQASIYTDDDQLWARAQEVMRTGALLRNRPPTFRVDHMPYGGVKRSGVGHEGVSYAFHAYSERRLLIS